jgi:hypothetical protein
MKPLLLFITLLYVSSLTVKAQKPDPVQAIGHYKFSHLRDTTKPDDIYTKASTVNHRML